MDSFDHIGLFVVNVHYSIEPGNLLVLERRNDVVLG